MKWLKTNLKTNLFSSNDDLECMFSTKYWQITFFEISDQFKITWAKIDLRSDHDLGFPKKGIWDKIVIFDHFLKFFKKISGPFFYKSSVYYVLILANIFYLS